MARLKVSHRKAQALSLALSLIGLAIISYLGAWWPGIMLAIGVPLALRQYLLSRYYDAIISLFVFVGIFITARFDVSWDVLLPVLFTIGALYILFREYLESKEAKEPEKEEDLNEEIEEEQKH
ncbi:MAG: hypothetical protein ACM3JI_03250 [Anaerolineae bacterium]